MRFQSRVSLVGTIGWMITTFPVFSSGPELKYVLLWNGTLILVAIGFSASCRALLSCPGGDWAKEGLATMMTAATVTQRASVEATAAPSIPEDGRQLDRCACIADQPFRSANQFRADTLCGGTRVQLEHRRRAMPWPTPYSVNGVIVNARGDTRLSMDSPRCGEHGEPEKSLAEEKQESGETESLRP
jgi:hypothetical protein